LNIKSRENLTLKSATANKIIVGRRTAEGLFYILVRNERQQESSPLFTYFDLPPFLGVGEVIIQKVYSKFFQSNKVPLFYDSDFSLLLKRQLNMDDPAHAELCMADCPDFTPPGMIWLTLPQALKLDGLIAERKVLLLLLQYLAKSHEGLVKAVEDSDLVDGVLDCSTKS
jgi:hypothetical protein